MRIKAILWLSLALLAGCAAWPKDRAPEPPVVVADDTFREGIHYSLLIEPLPAGVAPVVKFFYYGCRACYQLADAVAGWSRETGIPVALVPAHGESALVDAARLYHTLVHMDQLRLYKEGYVLFQTETSVLQGADRIDDFLQAHDISREAFWHAWESEAVNRRLAGSYWLTRLADVSATPAFVVRGRYKVELAAMEGVDQLFSLLEYLAGKAEAGDDRPG